MPADETATASAGQVLDEAGLDSLICALAAQGYQVIGPTVRDSAIVLAELSSAADLPAGARLKTGPGHYRLSHRDDRLMFAHSAGPQSWKQFLHPARRRLWSGPAAGPVEPAAGPAPRYAFLGVRGCDLAAIATLGRVLGGGASPDGSFLRRRQPLFIIAVNCTEPGGVCFCASMGTGPAAGPGYDLALTERIDAGRHVFVVDVGSQPGEQVLAQVPHTPADHALVTAARREVADAAGRMGRQMPAGDLRQLLRDSRDSGHWEEIAQQCLTCGNCTMACPTCFCTSTEDVTDLTGDHAERWQHWASCFELDFSYLHGGSVRQSGASRYRQWISHKLSTWHDQFGTSGCVGCGRCIAWCPAGIDITEEMTTLARDAGQPGLGSDDDC
jgi:ferredoxin